MVVDGTATDTSGRATSVSVTINMDRTPPDLAVSSPEEGATFATPFVEVTGTASDDLSGLASVTCNKVPANVTGDSFSCEMELTPGINLLNIWATDVAGNIAAAHLHVTANLPRPEPKSLQVSPTCANIVVGGTQMFNVVDETGHPRPDVTWAATDSSLADISTDDVGNVTVTALAGGRLKIRASVGNSTAEGDINIWPDVSQRGSTSYPEALPGPRSVCDPPLAAH